MVRTVSTPQTPLADITTRCSVHCGPSLATFFIILQYSLFPCAVQTRGGELDRRTSPDWASSAAGSGR